MPLLAWDDKYSVNNEELDRDHKALFEVVNKLYDSCFDLNNKISLGSIIEILISYTNHHFTTEEEYMRAKGYSKLDKHIAEHKIFRYRLLHLQSKENINDIELTKELIVYLGNWLLNHVIKEDKKYSV